MIPLGLCPAPLARSHPHRRVGHLALLMAEGTAQLRLSHCLYLREEIESFLPFAPRHAPDLDRAIAWTERNATKLKTALEEIRGQAEMIITVPRSAAQRHTTGFSDQHPPQPDIARPSDLPPGRVWLQARRVSYSRRQADAAALLSLAPDARLLTARRPLDPVEATILMAPRLMPQRAEHLRKSYPHGQTCRFSGPWPAYHFASDLMSEIRGEAA